MAAQILLKTKIQSNPFPSQSMAAPSSYEINFNGINVLATVADTPGMVNSALNDLRSTFRNTIAGKPVVVGLDVEWKPNYSTYDNNKVATLQLCHGNHCVIIQLLHLDTLPQSLKTFLTDQSVRFVGVGITEDVAKLGRDYGFQCGPVVELGPLAATTYGQQFHRSGLVELARFVVGLVVDKPASITHSDWSARSLTIEQIQYATIDAYASFAIGNKLLGGN